MRVRLDSNTRSVMFGLQCVTRVTIPLDALRHNLAHKKTSPSNSAIQASRVPGFSPVIARRGRTKVFS